MPASVTVTIGSNVDVGNNSTSGFESVFYAAYNKQGRMAGTYTCNNGRWSRN